MYIPSPDIYLYLVLIINIFLKVPGTMGKGPLFRGRERPGQRRRRRKPTQKIVGENSKLGT